MHLIEPALKPYLARSAAAHLALSAALVLLLSRSRAQPEAIYRIDFIGGAAGIVNRDREPPAAAARPAPPSAPAPAKPPPQKDPDDFALGRRRFRLPLPRPSFLAGPAAPASKSSPLERPRPWTPPSADSGPAIGPSGPSSAPGPGGEATFAADMPNFPYPWYLTRLRGLLWERWSERMPAASGRCRVVFAILRGGALTDVKIEDSSGDGGFDYAALSAVRDAAPFAPLPAAFPEPFLKVHVEFRSQ